MNKDEIYKIYRKEYMKNWRKGKKYSIKDAEPLIKERLLRTVGEKRQEIENNLNLSLKVAYTINQAEDLFNYDPDYLAELNQCTAIISNALHRITRLGRE
jgi:hypothetical protein